MKVRSAVRKLCKSCKFVHRRGRLHVTCVVAKHKQRQGLHTLAPAAAAAAPAPARLTVADAQVLALAMGLPAAALPAAPRLL